MELKNKYQIPDSGSITVKFKASAQQTHERDVTNTFTGSTGEQYDMSTRTEFDDLVSATSKQVNIYTYPVIGEFVCPACSSRVFLVEGMTQLITVNSSARIFAPGKTAVNISWGVK